MARRKNIREKAWSDLNVFEQAMNATYGQVGLQDREALEIASVVNQIGRFPENPIFAEQVRRVTSMVMDRVHAAVQTGNADSLLSLAHACKQYHAACHNADADPLRRTLLSLSAPNSRTGVRKSDSMTRADVQAFLAAKGRSFDLSSISKAARQLGVRLKAAKVGSPKGQPHPILNRASR